MYGEIFWQPTTLIVTLFLAALYWVVGGLACLVTSPVGLIYCMVTVGSTPTAALISLEVVSGAKFYLL